MDRNVGAGLLWRGSLLPLDSAAGAGFLGALRTPAQASLLAHSKPAFE